jgi:hypothetical protein
MTVIRSVVEREVMTPIQVVSSDEASTSLLEHDLKNETEIRSSVLQKDFVNEDIKGHAVEMDTSTDFTPFPTEDADDTFSCVEIIDQGLDMKTTLSGHAGFEKQSSENQKDIWISSKDDNAVVSIGDGGIVPRAPPSVMRQSTFDYGSVVTSKSRMAGLKTKHSSKLKRLYPDSSLFIKRILKYHPPEVIVRDTGVVSFYGSASQTQFASDHEELPLTFENVTEMRKLFSPILLAEGISALKQEFLSNSDTSGIWSRDVMPLQLVVCLLWFLFTTLHNTGVPLTKLLYKVMYSCRPHPYENYHFHFENV